MREREPRASSSSLGPRRRLPQMEDQRHRRRLDRPEEIRDRAGKILPSGSRARHPSSSGRSRALRRARDACCVSADLHRIVSEAAERPGPSACGRIARRRGPARAGRRRVDHGIEYADGGWKGLAPRPVVRVAEGYARKHLIQGKLAAPSRGTRAPGSCSATVKPPSGRSAAAQARPTHGQASCGSL